MNKKTSFTFFVARKLQQQHEGRKVALPITRIATFSIALAMMVNIITIAVVDGFQTEVSNKVTGFGSHISIQKFGENTIEEAEPLQKNSSIESTLQGLEGVTSVQSVAYKPALMQSRSKDDQKEILGVVLKGVDKNYDWGFFKDYIVEGKLPKFKEENSNEILISKRIANDLHYKVNDTLNAYFVKKTPIQRQFRIVGIYETGLEDFDKKLAFVYLPQVQQLNDWGIQSQIVIDDTLFNGTIIVRADVKGGNGNYRYNWGEGWSLSPGFNFIATKDTTFTLIVADFINRIDEAVNITSKIHVESSVPDTCYFSLKRKNISTNFYRPKVNSLGEIEKKFLDEDGFHYLIKTQEGDLEAQSFQGKGSFHNYIGAYEIGISDFNLMDELQKSIKKRVELNPDFLQQVQVSTIKENEAELFTWLDFLDYNLIIVVVLMLVIGIVNMGSALLVIIMVRTSFIGLMKAMGTSNWMIRKIFLVYIGRMIVYGMIWGNLLGFGLCLLQDQFKILPLDPKVYYLNAVPISMNWGFFLILNMITLSVCLLVLLIPSFLIARISPAKSIKAQ